MDEFEELMEEHDNDQEGDQNDDSALTIDDHDGAIFAVDTFNNLLATGGEDDRAFIWTIKSSDTGLKYEKLLETEKFEDSVTMLKFSSDGKYLAVSDMSGKIRVYQVNDTCELFWCYDTEIDLETLDWHPGCNVLFCATAEGQFMMFKISTNEIKIMYSGDDCRLTCFKILKEGKHAVCCYANGNVRMWDLKTGQATFSIVKAHEEEVLCMDVSEDGRLLVTGGVDMKVNVITLNNGKIVWKFTVESMKSSVAESAAENDDNNNLIENSIESVGLCKTQPIVACCTVNGQIITWDMNTHAMRHKIDYETGFSKLMWAEYKLFASALDGTVQQWDGRSMEMTKKYEGHSAEILDFCLSDKKFLCTASNDQTVKIFEIQ